MYKELSALVGCVLGIVVIIFGVIYLLGGFESQRCDTIERQIVTLHSGKRILVDVCTGEWE